MSVIISVLIFSEPTAPASPLPLSFVAMSVKCEESVKAKVGIGVEVAGQLIEDLPEDVKNQPPGFRWLLSGTRSDFRHLLGTMVGWIQSSSATL